MKKKPQKKQVNQRTNQREGSSQKRAFDGVTKEIETIAKGMSISAASDKISGLKALLNFTTKTNIDMNQETFNKAEFNRRCHKSINGIKDKLIVSGNKIDCDSITINTKSGRNVTIPGDSPFSQKEEVIYTQRFRERMDFIGAAFINMLIQACDEELEYLDKNFANLKDDQNGKS